MTPDDVPDEMMRAALKAWFGDLGYELNEYRSDQWWRHKEAQMRAALAAVIPMIRRVALEEAAKVAADDEISDYQTNIRDAIAAAIRARP
jgi:hypothetical protein